MLTVNKLIPGARGLAPVLLKRAASVELTWVLRQKNRFEATDSHGRALGVLLPPGTAVRGGDALVAEDGSLIRVLAAPQALLLVRHCPQHGSAVDLARAAYQLGLRQVSLELQADHLKLEHDPLLAELLRGMHLIVSEETLVFEPEIGAQVEADHDHDDAHGHGHEHSHQHGHGFPPTAAAPPARPPLTIPIQSAPAPHVHGPGCGHDHGDHHHR